MSVAEAIRSWKDEDFLMMLSEEQKGLLPDNPAGDAGQDLAYAGKGGDVYGLTISPLCPTMVYMCSKNPRHCPP